VARALAAEGWTVRGVDRAPGRWTDLVGDLRDERVCRAAVHAADVVVHTAALHAPHVGLVADAEFRAVNVTATEALLDRAQAAGVRRVVYISSTSVYGDALVPADRAVWVDESLPPRPRDIYDETKLDAEHWWLQCPADQEFWWRGRVLLMWCGCGFGRGFGRVCRRRRRRW
jgi:UDP-glucose 4-epimerase